MAEKAFRLPTKDLQKLATVAGTCIASDRISVEGSRVGMMFREPPRSTGDSGWRFLAGDESDEYRNTPSHHEEFDLDVIANHDRDIVPLLDSPAGKAYARVIDGDGLVRADSPVDPDSCLHPDFPIVEGVVSLDDRWSIRLPYKFNRRVEEGDTIFWRVGMTVFVSRFENHNNDTLENRLVWLRDAMSDQAFDVEVIREDRSCRLAYRLHEQRRASVLHAIYAFQLIETGHLQMAIYTDDSRDLGKASDITKSAYSSTVTN
jgi:hypothetical protein